MRRVIIIWDRGSIQHIGRHQVTPDEVEEVLTRRFLLRKGRYGRYYVLGRTEAGRYLFVVLFHISGDRFKVVTARDMTKSERRFYRKKVKP